ncbi:hydantoinase B/oxoprolinase family protein [Staphylococcus sp. IVB6181]|uniref:hydantoinase B/oxoprolinase family protein n=1 Tax=Staphylococcus sp. IVB6181 TaxID=2929481 RepID=UPI0021CF2CBC|nr:hydantoinase B/oxoprolinase family protein [Staphylococcus sp. IVB6181]UXV35167.1 hydantoinase B/oxoprolinase family protein [Staphylococcus sp. IVB6181]
MSYNTDPFTYEVIKDSLISTGEEMFIALARTSMSPIIYEVLDYACGLTNKKGELVTLGNGVTGFIGMLSFMVKETLKTYGDDIHEGDVFILNDPYNGGGSHLCDVGLVLPIFEDGELVAFVANKAHWTEVGGKDTGSMSTNSTEVYQEGLQFPCIKLFDKGVKNEAIIKIIESNVRFPQLSIGDMWAQIASLKTGERRIKGLCKKYSTDAILESMDRFLDQGETLTLKEIAKLPNGVYEVEEWIDDDGITDDLIPVQLKLTITDDEFICDFRGSSPQVQGPINSSYTGLVSAVRTIFLAITNPSQEVNDGAFRPLKIITDEGSIISAKRPAPVSMYWESMLYGTEMIWRALAPVLPKRLTAGHLLSVCVVIMGGKLPEKDENFLIVEPSVGGWGAADDFDGDTGQFCISDGQTFNVPVEIAEHTYGIEVEEFSMRTDGKGAGKHRGGSGAIRTYKALTDGQFFTGSFGHHKSNTWGADGGHEGSNNEFLFVKADGTVDGPYGKYNQYPLNKGDKVVLRTATGGGYGDPKARSREAVARDLKNGIITSEQAQDVYGYEQSN